MKPSPPGSSSDLERARAIARRLSQESPPGQAPALPDDDSGYIRFSALRFQGAPAGAPPVPAPPVPRPAAPAPLPPPPEEVAGPGFLGEEHESVTAPQRAANAPDASFAEVDAEGPSETDAEDIIDQLVAEVEEESEAPAWGQILEACIAVSDSRAGLIVDAQGSILVASDQLPQSKLDAIAGRLFQAMEGIEADEELPEASRSAAVQLGAYWLTGLRVLLGDEAVTIGLLASGQIAGEMLPAVAAEVRRAAP